MRPGDAAHAWARSVIGKTPRTDAPDGHAAWVSPHEHWRGGPRWRARCECGWFTTARPTFAEAEQDRRAHWDGLDGATLF